MNMQPQRGTTTEHLADIIEILRIGNKSGTLVFERGEGKTREEGSIIFTNGQPVEARVNQQSGSAAFNYLSTWQRCHFSFVSSSVAATSSPRITQFSPSIQGGSVNSGGAPGKNYAQSERATGQLNEFYESGNRAKSSLPKRLLRGEEALQHLEHAQLPRIHRRLLLLIDGRRSVDELARLMTRDLGEVHKLLDDLEYAGFIQK
jgi:hypothetical protein